MNEITFSIIGHFQSDPRQSFELPRQPSEQHGITGKIVLVPGYNFEQALEGLEGFDRIWLLFAFDRATGWRPKILPTRGGKKVGVFASRAPYRPSPIGMSAVYLQKIEGRTFYVSGCDLLDKTPIIDIKPYIPSYDSFATSSSGWLSSLSTKQYQLAWAELARSQLLFLSDRGVVFSEQVFHALGYFSGPSHYNRIKALGGDRYVMAYREWRFYFSLCSQKMLITIEKMQSGYVDKESVPEIHRQFFTAFCGSYNSSSIITEVKER